ncbi:MAG: hypothetical protein Roseis2KO_41800 [Roseivirga sp.]
MSSQALFELLLTVFSENSLATIKESEKYNRLVAANSYRSNFEYLEKQFLLSRGQLEKFVLNKGWSNSQQVSQCIRIFKNLQKDGSAKVPRKLKEKSKIFVQLVERMFFSTWSNGQIDYFNKAVLHFTKQYDYFLSFSDRVLNNQEKPNPINTMHKFLIKKITTEDFVGEKKNGLSRAMNQLFIQDEQVGYFYEEYKGNNEKTLKKLKDSCRDSRNFIQLIQNLVFVPPLSGGRNFCFFEFEIAYDLLEDENETFFSNDNMAFVLAEGQRQGLEVIDIHTQYQDWFSYMREKDTFLIESIQTNSIKKLITVEDQIKQKVVSKVRKNEVSVERGVPD